MSRWVLALALLAAPAEARATPLFASDAPIRIAIQGPVNLIVRKAAVSVTPQPATLNLASPAESHAILLSARGLSRRTGDICQFPPLRVEFAQPPAASSLFKGQRRLKLVTHCRSQESFQQHLLVEYAAYRIFNLISPASYRARLATVDYVEPNGKVSASRWGFFIEDLDDAAKRNGMTETMVGNTVLAGQLDPRQAARVALFQYMIGNLDWSMRAGPRGEPCCHNSRMISGGGRAYLPLPYDFDYSGLVDAPYAIPPDLFHVPSVRTRVYQGYCRHNAEALAAAAEFRAQRPAVEAMFGQVPGMTAKTRAKSIAYLGEFYARIATDQAVQANILKGCF